MRQKPTSSDSGKRQIDPLNRMLQSASTKVLIGLVKSLVASEPGFRLHCIDYLMRKVPLSEKRESHTRTGAAFALWSRVEPAVMELDRLGGGDDDTIANVNMLLDDLADRLRDTRIARADRRKMLSHILPYIESGNSCVEDALYSVADGLSHDDQDLLHLAEHLEAIGRDWPVDHARLIYKDLGMRDKYLPLRLKRMVYGADYHELALFYWESGEHQKALEVAEQGMEKAIGRMDELREFMTERALEAGDRKRFLEIQFAHALDRLTVQEYNEFVSLCSADEWALYEPKLLKALSSMDSPTQLQIHLAREEFEVAINILSGMTYYWDSSVVDSAALQLEKHFPERVAAFYISALGSESANATRSQYARQAKIALKLRRLWCDVMNSPEKWISFARDLRTSNLRRPAFQVEFAEAIPGWRDL